MATSIQQRWMKEKKVFPCTLRSGTAEISIGSNSSSGWWNVKRAEYVISGSNPLSGSAQIMHRDDLTTWGLSAQWGEGQYKCFGTYGKVRSHTVSSRLF